jgi:hypothetical protein
MSPGWSDEETTDPLYADDRNFYKVEMWTDDELHIGRLLYAGSNLEKARMIFDEAVDHRPAGHYTIRQRIRVLDKWPKAGDDGRPDCWRPVRKNDR